MIRKKLCNILKMVICTVVIFGRWQYVFLGEKITDTINRV